MENAIELSSVTKRFGKQTAVDDLNLVVPSGAIYGFIGPNGSGKTTTLRMILRIIQPESGVVRVLGNTVGSTADDDLGYLPEERGMYKRMKVRELLTYFAKLKGMYNCRSAIDEWLERLGATEWANKKIEMLSKGMAQKIQFIVTVLHQPKLLIFDEPFSGFDPINANLIKDQILQLRAEGATVIFSTHRMESVEELCDHIALIHQSKKILDGNLNDIKRNHKSNSFEVGLSSTNSAHLKKQISSRFDVSLADFKSLEDDLKLNIQLGAGDTPKDLLAFLNTNAQINHFVEVIPTANDIFIQTVKNN